jgi:hypothetical protein
MAEIGKVFLNEKKADVIYSFTSGTGIVDIADLDTDGYRFLSDLKPGSVITLREKNGNELKLLVSKITIGKNIACQAVITK